MSQEFKKILVVNVNWLGDVIFSSPVFKALKGRYPQATISCLAVPRVAEILECVPALDRVIVYDEEGRHKSFFAKAKLIFEIFRENFDAAFILHRSLTRALLVFFAGIPRRIGYDTKKRGIFLTHRVKPVDATRTHRVDYYLQTLESFGVGVTDRSCSLQVGAAVLQEMRDLLKTYGIGDEDFLVAIHPGGNWDLKRWPARNFTLLIERLMNTSAVKVVLLGSRDDIPLAENIVAALRDKVKPVVLTGKLGLKQLMAVMKRADCAVSADSGPLHIAGSLGTSVIGIFGPTRPEITGPRGGGNTIILQEDVGCNRRACYELSCPDNICMQAVNVKKVFDAICQIRHN